MAGLSVSVPDQPGWSGVSASPVHALWRSVDGELGAAVRAAAERGDLEDLLDALSSSGVRRTPDFVAVLEGDPLRVVTRGVASAVGFGPAGPVEFRAGGRGPWDDDDSPQAVERIELRPGAMVADGSPPPSASAAAPAASPAPVAEPVRRLEPAPAPEPEQETDLEQALSTKADPEPEPRQAPSAWRAPAVFSRERPTQPPALDPEPPAADPAAAPAPAPVTRATDPVEPVEAEVEDLPSYDHLFGATEHVRPQPRMIDPHDTQGLAEPAIGHTHHESAGGYVPGQLETAGGLTLPPPSDTERPPAPPASPAPTAPTHPPRVTSQSSEAPARHGPPDAPKTAGRRERPDPSTAGTGQRGALIDSVPWRSGGSNVPPPAPAAPVPPTPAPPGPEPAPPLIPAAPPPAAPAPVPLPTTPATSEPTGSTAASPDEDDAEATVDRSALLAAQGAPAQTGPMVLAVLCPAGHSSPPHAGTCRVCERPIPPQQPFQTPRPALGTLRLSTGDVVTLDRGVLLGRSPKLNADLPAGDRPHLVRVPSPENDISRNHVEVVLEGWHVLVRDLGSTNGTTVTLPGQPPVRLRPSDSQVVEPGTVVTLADEVTLTYEVTPS